MERSTRVLGTSRTGMPREASMRPGAPGITFGLFAPWATTSAQSSSSRPLTIMASARRTLTMRLGRTSRSWGFWLGRAMASTSARSPVTASVSDFRSVVVVTMRSLSAAETPCAPGALQAVAAARAMARNRRMVINLSSSERMRRVRTHDKGGLEEILAYLFGAAAVVLEVEVAAALTPRGLLVPEPEAQELRWIVREEGLPGPLGAGGGGILGPVVPEAQEPLGQLSMVEGLEPGVDVETLAVAEASLVVAVRIGHDHVAERHEVLPDHAEGRMLPARRRVLVLGVPADDGAGFLLWRLARG